jgi:hypothetical protein
MPNPADWGGNLGAATPAGFSVRQVPPIIKALAAQSLALLVSLSVLGFAARIGLTAWSGLADFPFAALAFGQGLLAALFSRWLGMMAWWLPIQFLFVPGLLLGQTLPIPSHWYLLAFLALLAVYWSVFRTQVPLYLSSKAAWRAVSRLMPEKPNWRVIDLGSGLGGLLAHLARVRPQGRYAGMESAPLPFLAGWLRCARLGCDMRFGSFWKHDLGNYDLVHAYLSPVPMAELWLKAKAEMRPGSLFVSNTFPVPGAQPAQTIALDDFHAATLYVYAL